VLDVRQQAAAAALARALEHVDEALGGCLADRALRVGD
jgi:hypothetical protein